MFLDSLSVFLAAKSKAFRNAYLEALIMSEEDRTKAFEELKSKNSDMFRCFDRYFRH